jgi:hypothetical protein
MKRNLCRLKLWRQKNLTVYGASHLQQVERKESLTAGQLQLLKKVFEVITPIVDSKGRLNVVHFRRLLILARIDPEIGQVCSIYYSCKLVNLVMEGCHWRLCTAGEQTTCTSWSQGYWEISDRIGWITVLHLAISPSIALNVFSRGMNFQVWWFPFLYIWNLRGFKSRIKRCRA